MICMIQQLNGNVVKITSGMIQGSSEVFCLHYLPSSVDFKDTGQRQKPTIHKLSAESHGL